MAELVEGARLESGYMGNCVVGSNPTLSAIKEYQKFLIKEWDSNRKCALWKHFPARPSE